MIQNIMFWIWIIFAIFLHEFGHKVIAEKQKIYEKWAILPTPHIKMKRPYNNPSDYLSGLLFSFASYPLFIWTGETLPIFLFYIFGLAIGDYILIGCWFYLKKKGESNV